MVRLMWLLRPLDRSAAVEDWATEMAPAANALATGRWHQICRLLTRSKVPTTFAVLLRQHLLCCHWSARPSRHH